MAITNIFTAYEAYEVQKNFKHAVKFGKGNMREANTNFFQSVVEQYSLQAIRIECVQIVQDIT